MQVAPISVCLAAALLASSPALAGGRSGGSSHSVKPYTTKNGTYVPGHNATNPNTSKLDNWSTKGNTNPYTGKEGTVDPNKAK